MTFTFGSLFAGIGGLDLGLERAGMSCAWQVENSEFCQKVLTKHWPSVPKFGDIKDVGKGNLETVDAIVGGFPCQPFSNAGKRRGTEDDRHLWPEMLRVISELQPAWVIGENVPGIIPIFLDQAIDDLEAEGYTCGTFVLPALAFDAPHRRDRLFIMAYSQSKRLRKEGRAQRRPKTWASSTSAACRAISDTDNRFSLSEKKEIQSGGIAAELGGEIVAHTNGKRSQIRQGKDANRKGENERPKSYRNSIWTIEPELGRVAHGVPNRVDRLRGLGNAVVPQVAEHIGRMILESIEAANDNP